LLLVHLWSHCNGSDSNIGSLWGCLTRLVLLLLLLGRVARLWCFPWCRARVVNVVVEGCVGCGRCYLVSSWCRFYIIESCRRPWKCGRSWNRNTCNMRTANRVCVSKKCVINTFHIRFETEIIVQRFELFTHQNVPTELASHDAFLSIASVRHDRPIMIWNKVIVLRLIDFERFNSAQVAKIIGNEFKRK